MVNLRLKALRLENNMTQANVSACLKIARETYSRYESGEREMTYESLVLLADLYKVSVDYLLGRYEKNPVLLDDVEFVVIKKYRRLDERGKNTIHALLDYELLQAQAI